MDKISFISIALNRTKLNSIVRSFHSIFFRKLIPIFFNWFCMFDISNVLSVDSATDLFLVQSFILVLFSRSTKWNALGFGFLLLFDIELLSSITINSIFAMAFGYNSYYALENYYYWLDAFKCNIFANARNERKTKTNHESNSLLRLFVADKLSVIPLFEWKEEISDFEFYIIIFISVWKCVSRLVHNK